MRKLFLFLTMFGIFSAIGTAQIFSAQKAFAEAVRDAQNRSYETAFRQFENALNLAQAEGASDDFFAKIRYNRGVCLFQTNRLNEAVAEFKEAARLSRETYQKAFYALGMAEFALKNADEAEKAFRRALELNQKDGESWFDLAFVLLHKKDLAAARKAFQKAIANKSVNYADAHNNIGVISALNGDLARAENEFKTALRESNGKSIEAANNLQFCKFYRQNIAEKPVSARFQFSLKNNFGG